MTLLETCVDSLAAALAAEAAGAGRLELCSRLDLGGLTPPAELVTDTLAGVRIPVHAMVRPRGDGFCYSEPELDAMRRSILDLRASRVAGVVLGVLTAERAIDRERTAELLALARPLSVTFHRAFDEARDTSAALETLIELGVDRVLTSGGAATAPEGAARLRELADLARGRITILAGGGVRPGNVARLLAESGVSEVHASVAFHLPR